MSRTFNFKQSQTLLDVDPKTFGRWLVKAKIDPSKQINLADPREKFLTEEQILLLAKDHGRDVHLLPPDQEDVAESKVLTLPTLDERFAALEQEITRRFDQLEARLQTFMADVRRDLANQPNATPSPYEHPPAAPKPAKPAQPSPTLVRSSKRSRTKKRAKAKTLPKALVPLALFKSEHKVSDKAIEYALEKRKITVERGKWTYNNRNVMVALGKLGQHEFYTLFHERENFQRCEQCPHAL